MQTSEHENFGEVLAHFDTAMLVTRSVAGQLHARPMAIARRDGDESLYFVADRDSGKLEEVLREPHVCVSMQSSQRFLSLSGTAHVDDDRSKIEEMWSPAWRAWFPEGPSDQRICLLCVEPTFGEYWDIHGTRRLTYLLEAGKALVKGEQLDPKGVDHGRVHLT